MYCAVRATDNCRDVLIFGRDCWPLHCWLVQGWSNPISHHACPSQFELFFEFESSLEFWFVSKLQQSYARIVSRIKPKNLQNTMSGLTKFEKLGLNFGGYRSQNGWNLKLKTRNALQLQSSSIRFVNNGLTNDDDICLSQFSLEEFVWTP